MLPFLAPLLGAGLNVAGLSALQAGLATGLGTAIATKDLSKGLTAGLGAFGGAGLTQGLGQAGTVGQQVGGMGEATSGLTDPASSAFNATKNTFGGATVTPDMAQNVYSQLGSSDRLASIQKGIGALGDPAAMEAAGGGGKLAMSGLTALTPTLETQQDYTMPGGPSMIRPSSYDPSTGMFTDLEPYPARSGGTIPGLASQVRMQQGGRYLSGQGDGMSDSIKANIDGKMEARLSDGEFVIPADVVSGIGNGSSDAGARRLHGMMDRVRTERTGRKMQAPEVDPAALMPA